MKDNKMGSMDLKVELSPTVCEDNFDFFLKEVGLTREDLKRAVIDVIPVPNSRITIGPSQIDGLGVMAERDFKRGDDIGEAFIAGKWTTLGRYTNHALFANCIMRREGRILRVIAKEVIPIGAEITLSYWQVRETVEHLNQPSP